MQSEWNRKKLYYEIYSQTTRRWYTRIIEFQMDAHQLSPTSVNALMRVKLMASTAYYVDARAFIVLEKSCSLFSEFV